jgi:hypothetical protein
MSEQTNNQKEIEEQLKEFENIVRPVIKWMAQNQHPHTAVIIDGVRAELVEGVMQFQTHEYIPD